MSEMQAEEKPKEKPKLSEGVALLVQRMESHPEEFTHGSRKWEHVLGVVEERIFNPQGMRRAEPWMTDDEVRAIWGGYQKAKQKSFHDFVMKKLLNDKEGEEEEYVGQAALNNAMVKRGMLAPNSMHPGTLAPITPYPPTDHSLDAATYFAPIKKIFGMK